MTAYSEGNRTFSRIFNTNQASPAFDYIYDAAITGWRPFDTSDLTNITISGVTVDMTSTNNILYGISGQNVTANQYLSSISGDSKSSDQYLAFISGQNVAANQYLSYISGQNGVSALFVNTVSGVTGNYTGTQTDVGDRSKHSYQVVSSAVTDGATFAIEASNFPSAGWATIYSETITPTLAASGLAYFSEWNFQYARSVIKNYTDGTYTVLERHTK